MNKHLKKTQLADIMVIRHQNYNFRVCQQINNSVPYHYILSEEVIFFYTVRSVNFHF